jgi:riboflavin biosynthesis pyrimidine reductase
MLYGGELAASLIREALVDEIHSYINPVCLGGGTPMFPTLEPVLRLRLIDLHSFASGVVLLRYSTRSDA